MRFLLLRITSHYLQTLLQNHLNLQILSDSKLILRLLSITKEGPELAFDHLILAVASLRVHYKRHV